MDGGIYNTSTLRNSPGETTLSYCHRSLGKQPTFGHATTGFPTKWRLRNERRNSILMTRQYPDLGSASDWSSHVGNLIQPVRSTTQIWIVTRHQYRISVLVSQTSFGGKTSGCVAKCPLFSRVTFIGVYIYIFFHRCMFVVYFTYTHTRASAIFKDIAIVLKR